MRNAQRKQIQHGITLIELIVALGLSALVLTTLGRIYMTSRIQAQTQETSARIQENARQAMQYLSDDVRMAGFMGPVYQYWLVEESQHSQSELPAVTGECFTTPFRWAVPFLPVGGNPDRIAPRLYGQDSTYSWFNGCITTNANFQATGDVIAMHYAGLTWQTATGALQTSAIPDASIDDNDEAFYIRGNSIGAAVFTCGKGTGQGAVGTGGGNSCLNRLTTGPNRLNNTALLNSMSPATGETTNYGIQAVLYYLRPCTNPGSDNQCGGSSDDTVPALVRARMEYNTSRCPTTSPLQPCVVHEVVAEGVVSMQLQYGVDTTPDDGDDNVNRYFSASGISTTLNSASDYVAWSRVRTVRIWLLVRSVSTEPGYTANNTNGAGNTFNVAGTSVVPLPGYRYQLFTSTLSMRNRWRSF